MKHILEAKFFKHVSLVFTFLLYLQSSRCFSVPNTCVRVFDKPILFEEYKKLSDTHRFPLEGDQLLRLNPTRQSLLLTNKMAVPPDRVAAHYADLHKNLPLLEVMNGVQIHVNAKGKDFPLYLMAGWSRDMAYLPAFQQRWWNNVGITPWTDMKSFASRLQFGPSSVHHMTSADYDTLQDAGWIVVQMGTIGNPLNEHTANLKINYYEKDSPAQDLSNRLCEEFMLSQPRQIFRDAAKLASLVCFPGSSHWGVFDFEYESGYRIPEHNPENYDPHFRPIFSKEFFYAYHALFRRVIFDSESPLSTVEPSFAVTNFKNFKKNHIPDDALEVAALSRYNVPEHWPDEVRAAAHAQIYFAFLTMAITEPLKNIYASTATPKSGRPVHKRLYESMSFKEVKEFKSGEIPDYQHGGHVLASDKSTLHQYLIRKLLSENLSMHLLPWQIETLHILEKF